MSDTATTWAGRELEQSSLGPCVALIEGGAPRLVELPLGAEVSIGRSRSSALIVDHPSVSRLHATLCWRGGPSVEVTDHQSKHGTLLDGQPLRQTRSATDGARIEIGPARLIVMLPRATREGDDTAPLSPAARVERLAERAAACDLPVLLIGETGVGKEVLARRIHAQSARAKGPFVAVNAGAIPESLAESTLLGHERGAFTGAHARRAGVFEAADRGTLFLDEVAELPLATQVRLLRSLEEGCVTRVGGAEPVPVDVRFIAATHRDLDAMVIQGSFRRDLLYRLDVIRVALIPLRERSAEIPQLARTLLAELDPARDLAPDAEAALCGYAWPGNIRELRNVLARACALSEHATLGAADLEGLDGRARGAAGELRGAIDDAEREALVQALEACGGNQTKAAERLGISRRSLIYKLERHGLKRPPGKKAR